MDNDLAVFLGKAARQARKARGLTQAKVAELLDMSVEFYGRIERGVSLPSLETFANMVDVLDVSADALLDIDAVRAAMLAAATRTAPAEPPELRFLVPALRKARRATRRIVGMVLDEFEPKPERKPAAHEHPRDGGARKPPPTSSDGE